MSTDRASGGVVSGQRGTRGFWLPLALVVVVASNAFGAPASRAATRGADQAASLLTVEDLPPGWSEYTPPASRAPIRLRRGTCGEKLRKAIPSESEVVAAWAADNEAGPIFGERIESFRAGDAQRRIAQWRVDGLPCEWRDAGFRWRAEPLRPLGVGDDNAYLLRKLEGDFAYNYEYVVRRDRDVLTFVVNSRTPARDLAEALVGAAVARYDVANPR